MSRPSLCAENVETAVPLRGDEPVGVSERAAEPARIPVLTPTRTTELSNGRESIASGHSLLAPAALHARILSLMS